MFKEYIERLFKEKQAINNDDNLVLFTLEPYQRNIPFKQPSDVMGYIERSKTKANLYVASGYFDAKKNNGETRTTDNLKGIHRIIFDIDLQDSIELNTTYKSADKNTQKQMKSEFKKELLNLKPQELYHRVIDEYMPKAKEIFNSIELSIFSEVIYSGHGFYFILKVSTEDISRIVEIQENIKKLVGIINTKAGYDLTDPNATDMGTRVYRIPGTYNLKNPDRPVECKLLAKSDDVFITVERLKELVKKYEDKTNSPQKDKTINCNFIHIKDDIKNKIIEIINPYYSVGSRDQIIMSLSGFLAKNKISRDTAIEIIQEIAEKNNDNEIQSRIKTVQETYNKVVIDREKVLGILGLKDILSPRDILELDGLFNKDNMKDSKKNIDIQLVVEAVLKHFNVITEENNTNKPIYIYNEEAGTWKEDEVRLQQYIQELVGMNTFTEKFYDHVRLNLNMVSMKNVHFNSNSNIIVFKNGYIDVSEEELTLHPHSKDNYMTISIPHNFNLDKYKLFINDEYRNKFESKGTRFIRSIVKSEEYENLLKLLGLVMTTKIPDKMFFLSGEGANGKSSFIEVIQKLIGKSQYSNESFHRIADEKFVSSGLVGKLANIFADIGDKRILESSVIKSIITGDEIPVEKKYKDAYSARIFAKLIFSANTLPTASDYSYGYWRRNLIINFPYQFRKDVPEINNGKIFKADKTILDFLNDPEEMSLIATLAVYYLKKWMAEGFNESEDSIKTKEELRIESNSVAEFTEEFISASDDRLKAFSPDMIYQFYSKYCEAANKKPEQVSNFKKHLKTIIGQKYPEVGYKKYNSRDGQFERWQMVFIGLHFDEKYCNMSIRNLGGEKVDIDNLNDINFKIPEEIKNELIETLKENVNTILELSRTG